MRTARRADIETAIRGSFKGENPKVVCTLLKTHVLKMNQGCYEKINNTVCFYPCDFNMNQVIQHLYN